MSNPDKIKKCLLIFIVLNIFFSYTIVFAQEPQVYDYKNKAGVSKQIEDFLCAPTAAPKNKGDTPLLGFGSGDAASRNTAAGDLYRCINRLYRFAIIFASSVAIMFIVIAGYLYMSAEGNQEAVDKAKAILVSSITAIVILLIGYILLRAINPELIEFKSIQPPSVKFATPTPPTILPPGAVSEEQARKFLADNGITVNAQAPQTKLAGIRQSTLEEIVNLKRACGCEIVVTGGTEQGHSAGNCSHAQGFKVDLRPSQQLDNYIKSNFRDSGTRSDGAKRYTSGSGAVYALESNHWDVEKCQ